MFKLGLILLIMNKIEYCQKQKKNIIELMKNELGGKIMTELIGLGVKIYDNLIDSSEDKTTDKKNCVTKIKTQF